MRDLYKLKTFILFSFLLVLIPFSLAAAGNTILNEGVLVENSFTNSHKFNTSFELHIYIFNLSNGLPLTYADSKISCYFYLFNNTGGNILDTEVLTNNGIEYTKNISNYNFTRLGVYTYITNCNNSNIGGLKSSSIIITPTGEIGEIISQNNKTEIFLYFVFGLTILLLFIGFYKNDANLVSISSMLMLTLGVYIIVNGFAALNNVLSDAVGIIFIAVGFYMFIRSNIDSLGG